MNDLIIDETKTTDMIATIEKLRLIATNCIAALARLDTLEAITIFLDFKWKLK